METYQIIAWPVDIIVYARGKEIEKIDRGPHQSYQSMTNMLASWGYEVVGEWTMKKIAGDTVHMATARK